MEPLTLESKLDLLARYGLRLAPPFTPADLLESWDRQDFEGPGFQQVLVGLGMTEEREPWRPHSTNVWHFDTECIEGDGSYARIARRMQEIAEGSLPLEDIRDHVDLEAGEAWLEFRVQGQTLRFDCEVNHDWVDGFVFQMFVEALETTDSSKLYVQYQLDGQDCVIACIEKRNLPWLQKAGVNFEPL